MSLSQEGPKAFRNYEKCQQCRRDHKPCLRHSQSPSEKCERCTRLGHKCGPLVKAKAKGRPKTNLDTDDERKRTCRTSATCVCPFQTALSKGWLLDRIPNLGRATYSLAVNATAQRMFERYCSDLQVCLRSRLSSLRTLVDDTIKRCEWFKDSLKWFISQLHRHQLFGHQELWSQDEDIQSLSGKGSIYSSLDHSSGDFKVLVCSANVLSNPIHESPHRTGIRECFKGLPVEYYKSTELALKTFIESIFGNITGEENQSSCADSISSADRCRIFPASHIAYLNMDREAAFELWNASNPMPDLHTDILGRTLPHIAAEAGDTKLLESMDVQLLRKVKSDRRGFTLLDLAKISRSPATINFIVKNDIVPHCDQPESTDVYMCGYERIQEQYSSQLELIHHREVCGVDVVGYSGCLPGEYEYNGSRAQLKSFAHWNSVPQSGSFELSTYNSNLTGQWPSGSDDNAQYLYLHDSTFEDSPPISLENIVQSSLESSAVEYTLDLPHYADSNTERPALIDLTRFA